jgi:uncharacterized protein
MSRTALTYLKEWLERDDRKPMVLRGARQVGKTYTVRELAKVTGMQLIEVNFEKHIKIASLFSSNNPEKIIQNLETRLSIDIDIKKSILFLDEVQTEPEILAKLRWFAEDMPELAVVAAGSLLDFALDDHTFSMPVGRITYMYMNPLSFDEYLLLSDNRRLLRFLQNFTLEKDFPDEIHRQLMELFKEYLLVGGMPAALHAWNSNRSFADVQRIHLDLLSSYRDDFAKYAGKIPTTRLDDIIVAIPRLLGRKFVYSQVNADTRSQALKNSLELLTKARICQKVQACAGNGVPLLSETNPKTNKVVFLDVGLIASQLGLMLHEIQETEELNVVNSGAISEQVVGQLLQTIEPSYIDPSLCYWVREQKNSNAEIDYLIQHGSTIVPIEVKSGKSGTLKSLHLFMQEKKLSTAVRINSQPTSLAGVETQQANYNLLSIPFYMIGQLHRLLSDTEKL